MWKSPHRIWAQGKRGNSHTNQLYLVLPFEHGQERGGGGRIRPCGNYRLSNNVTVSDNYCLPNIPDFSKNIWGMRIFSSIDLMKDYIKIPVVKFSIPITLIIALFIKIAFLKMLLEKMWVWLSRDASTKSWENLPLACCYLDDVLVLGRNFKEHNKHVRIVLDFLKKNGLATNPTICKFFQNKVQYPCHLMDKNVWPHWLKT